MAEVVRVPVGTLRRGKTPGTAESWPVSEQVGQQGSTDGDEPITAGLGSVGDSGDDLPANEDPFPAQIHIGRRQVEQLAAADARIDQHSHHRLDLRLVGEYIQLVVDRLYRVQEPDGWFGRSQSLDSRDGVGSRLSGKPDAMPSDRPVEEAVQDLPVLVHRLGLEASSHLDGCQKVAHHGRRHLLHEMNPHRELEELGRLAAISRSILASPSDP